ncbi:hypothetical protein DYB38_002490 [Aphanomyces astaci]|uniref:Roadblock/LAMTOR2 domain-containing protein n=1 Tax=Aphanomyces astaci TaxID=112090 RepID=A0A397DHQ5_APHAT|nr:hypothetical protein DYB38_002490 [Aphanomyces astaci]
MSEVEETLERIKNHKGVEGYVIADKNGSVLRRHPHMDPANAERYSTYMKELTTKARGVVRDLNPKVRHSKTDVSHASPCTYAPWRRTTCNIFAYD